MILRPNRETLTKAEMIPDTTTEEAYPETTILVPETETRTKNKLGKFSFANSVFDVLKGKTWREALRHATNSSVNLGTVKEATESANVTGPLTSSKGNDKHQSMWNGLFRALVKEAEKASNSGPIDLPTKATTSSANVNSNTVSTRQEEEQTGYFTFSVKPKVNTAMPESNHYTQTSLQDEVDFVQNIGTINTNKIRNNNNNGGKCSRYLDHNLSDNSGIRFITKYSVSDIYNREI